MAIKSIQGDALVNEGTFAMWIDEKGKLIGRNGFFKLTSACLKQTPAFPRRSVLEILGQRLFEAFSPFLDKPQPCQQAADRQRQVKFAGAGRSAEKLNQVK